MSNRLFFQSKSSMVQSYLQPNTFTLLFSIFLTSSVFLPSIIHQQAITGPLINAILLLATILLGAQNAMVIGLLPSVVALSRGLLPIPLAPVVPLIMLANCLYVLIFNKFCKSSFITAVVGASIAKFGLLHLASQYLLASLLPNQFVTVASKMMSWPQLVTALAGGFIAGLIIKSFSLSTKK